MMIENLRDFPDVLPILADWHQEEWSHFNPGETLEERMLRMEDHLEVEDLVPSTFIAMDDAGALVGSAAIVECDLSERPELSPWLASVYVVPPFRGQGIGTRLVKYVEQAARDNGIKTLYLFTEDRLPFYEALGWQIKEPAVFHGCDVTIMERHL